MTSSDVEVMAVGCFKIGGTYLEGIRKATRKVIFEL
jgi:hypothetical protein